MQYRTPWHALCSSPLWSRQKGDANVSSLRVALAFRTQRQGDEGVMIDRRRVVQGGLAAAGSLSIATPMNVLAQSKPPVKVRYNEVVRSLMYVPAYVAITKGFFKEAGLDVSLTTAFGGDKSTAALLSGAADIALIGPETAIYVLNSDSSTKIRIFCGLTSTDGFNLV